MKTIQERFEQHFTGSFNFDKYESDGRYVNTNTMCAWLGYQAAVLDAHQTKTAFISALTEVMEREINNEKVSIDNSITL